MESHSRLPPSPHSSIPCRLWTGPRERPSRQFQVPLSLTITSASSSLRSGVVSGTKRPAFQGARSTKLAQSILPCRRAPAQRAASHRVSVSISDSERSHRASADVRRKVTTDSDGMTTSRLPVYAPAAVPAPAPESPPISAPFPPPASPPINAPSPAPPPMNVAVRLPRPFPNASYSVVLTRSLPIDVSWIPMSPRIRLLSRLI